VKPFKQHQGVAAPLLRTNIDTDTIIPSREMKRVSKQGLGDALFANWRYVDPAARTPNPDFVLNRAEHAGASILLAYDNFGCGSSREFAVWAISDFGVRAVLAPSFGSIFQRNCTTNGILCAVVSQGEVEQLARWVALDPQANQPVVDLEQRCVSFATNTFAFTVDDADRAKLIQGLDAIGATLAQSASIEAFEARHYQRAPWLALN